ncbi:sulfite exporter TauE/SafE family protein [Methylococcus sp. EFPC2]|uniref:sulfite exporter TauE/SafE family protein n=1 Tax=Methylococcus sp. EFPC2 TaxID=2812648 RepID=UPI0019670F60|nr:sulfite exporter TauE/SafE family protein [Methylococcus sp. EFPC2]QSA97084.1 sulfite exporter TauE/SafE family protein [Methylococcus sp. EFPC2]
MHEPLILLGTLAFFAGLIDSAVGGGGLIQIPALFTTLPDAPPATLFGTNKFASICGTATAARSYIRRVRLPWPLVLPAAVSAFVLSFAGAAAVSFVPGAAMKPVVLVLLIVMAVYTLWRKNFGRLHKPKAIGRRERRQAAAIGGAIGFYDGLFGPGTGSFLIFLFIRFFAFDFLHASAAAKFVNFATNLAALCFFVPSGNLLPGYAVAMAACNIAGSLVGTRLALRGGAGLVRWLFLILLGALIGKFACDLILMR